MEVECVNSLKYALATLVGLSLSLFFLWIGWGGEKR